MIKTERSNDNDSADCFRLCHAEGPLWEVTWNQALTRVSHVTHLKARTRIPSMQIKKQELEPDMEQWTGSKLGKEYIKAVYCPPAYLTYMQSTSCEIPGWMKHKQESRLSWELSITSDMQRIPPYSRKWRGTKESLDEGERGKQKSCLKTQHSKK